MRNLTVKRNKSFVGCLAKIKIYIEDPVNEETRINGVPCRKLGVLKNGEEKTFTIGTGATKIFAIADQTSRNYCNDYYPVPAGEEDVHLSGKNQYKPSAGNPFYFDGVSDENVLENRKRGKKRGILVLIVAAILGFAIGILNSGLLSQDQGEPATFTEKGMTITLTDAFEMTTYDGFDVCYESREAVVFALKESFSLAEGLENYTLAEYGGLIIEGNGMTGVELQTADGLTWFEYSYEDSETDDAYFYYAVIYKTDDAFWMIQFAAEQSQREEYAPLFAEWAKSVSFS